MSTIPAQVKPVVNLLLHQREVVETNARFTWSNWSRQIGKSFAFGLRRLKRGLERKRLQVLLSAGERQSRELMDKVRMHAKAIGAAGRFYDDTFFEGTSIRQLQMTFDNGCRVIALPANPDTARGFTGDVFLDEFAMHQHDREIWAALFPTVMRGRGELDVASTPKGKANMFFALASNKAFEHRTVTIYDAIDAGLDVDPEELRDAIGDDEMWRQEFLCEFLDEATAFITFEMMARIEDPELPAPVQVDTESLDALSAIVESIPGYGDCFLGVDIGRRHDLTVLWLLEQIENQLVTRGVAELSKVPFRQQFGAISAILRHSNVHRASIDETGLGMQIAEQAMEDFSAYRVDGVTFTMTVKQKLAEQLRIRVEDQTLRIPSDATLRNDWHSIQKMATTGGNVMYRADRNKWGHADRFWAAALAVDAAQTGSVGPIEYIGSKTKLAFARQGVW